MHDTIFYFGKVRIVHLCLLSHIQLLSFLDQLHISLLNALFTIITFMKFYVLFINLLESTVCNLF